MGDCCCSDCLSFFQIFMIGVVLLFSLGHRYCHDRLLSFFLFLCLLSSSNGKRPVRVLSTFPFKQGQWYSVILSWEYHLIGSDVCSLFVNGMKKKKEKTKTRLLPFLPNFVSFFTT